MVGALPTCTRFPYTTLFRSTAGCNGQGVCDQNHSSKVCPPADQCNQGCDTTSGQCTPQASTPCTDTDGNTCTTAGCEISGTNPDRKSTRLNSSHRCISYAVF